LPGYTFVAIPTEIVQEVIEFVEQHSTTPAVEPSSSRDARELLGWTELLLKRSYLESGDRMRDVLDYLASHPDREVTSDEIASAINAERGWNTVAGMLGAFSRRCTGRYGRPGFPWEHRWDANGKGQMKMPLAIADVLASADA
jgi:hypothetical protein